jgi:hypothetical protein
MISPSSLPDRQTIVATLCDYVEQLREEGMEGLPASVPSTQSIRTAASAPAAIERAAVPKSPKLFSKYPGLETTSTLENLREFIGD